MDEYALLKAKHETSAQYLKKSQAQSVKLFSSLTTLLEKGDFPLFRFVSGGQHHVYFDVGSVRLLARSEIKVKKSQTENELVIYVVRGKPEGTLTPLPFNASFDGIGNFKLGEGANLVDDFCVSLIGALTKYYLEVNSIPFYEEGEA
jgi:hypothetical protein